MSAGPKSSKALYRDCLRLIKHMAGTTSPKALSMRQIVGQQFRQHKDETDPTKIHALKQTAERGLSNYLVFERAKLDPKIAAARVEADQFEDDEHGNLVRVAASPAAADTKAAAAAHAAKRKAKAVADHVAPPTSPAASKLA